MGESEKITLPEELQKEMLKFIMKTSIPRKKREKLSTPSDKTDGMIKSEENH